MEKELKVPVLIVNKVGASGQVGLTSLASSKPDGYTIALSNQPGTTFRYLDPEFKAQFNRKSFQPLAQFTVEPLLPLVQPTSPWKTAKDLVDAVKAKPGSIKVSTPGLKSTPHVAMVMWEKAAGVQFTYVHFTGGGEAMTALLGGHVDCSPQSIALVLPQMKSGEVRALGIMDKNESPFFPGVKTLASQGWRVYGSVSYGISAPAGIPKEIVDILAGAIKKALESDDLKKKFQDTIRPVLYLSPEQYAAYWDETEETVKPLVKELSSQ
jgi:tripartite-type tricarboxylate transporter receptor subunit TctC